MNCCWLHWIFQELTVNVDSYPSCYTSYLQENECYVKGKMTKLVQRNMSERSCLFNSHQTCCNTSISACNCQMLALFKRYHYSEKGSKEQTSVSPMTVFEKTSTLNSVLISLSPLLHHVCQRKRVTIKKAIEILFCGEIPGESQS